MLKVGGSAGGQALLVGVEGATKPPTLLTPLPPG